MQFPSPLGQLVLTASLAFIALPPVARAAPLDILTVADATAAEAEAIEAIAITPRAEQPEVAVISLLSSRGAPPSPICSRKGKGTCQANPNENQAFGSKLKWTVFLKRLHFNGDYNLIAFCYGSYCFDGCFDCRVVSSLFKKRGPGLGSNINPLKYKDYQMCKQAFPC
ncbi:hypothetical protein B0H63DRAFT_523873 [Podospora didyma]|uniref:Uncharacterized protein n=1 Tax=Podospora didyma TaxID=330526 RepID=A0AAE0NGN8_9PEZI|nr:hypothetical protein B0H63DRAFT_523873 [Podospora didyma]